MSEIFPFEPSDESPSGNEHFSDDEPSQETLEHINDHLTSLARLDYMTAYRRSLDLQLDGDLMTEVSPINITLESRGIPNNKSDSAIRIELPTFVATSQGSLLRRCHLDIESKQGAIKVELSPPRGTTAENALANFYDRKDLPNGLMGTIRLIADAIIKNDTYNLASERHEFSIDKDRYEQLWTQLEDDINSSRTPVPMIAEWDSADTLRFVLPTDEEMRHVSLRAVVDEEQFVIDFAQVTTDKYDYMQQKADGEPSVYAFDEEIDDDKLAELTNEERDQNPFIVKDVNQLPHEEGYTYEPTSGYVVVNKDMPSRNMNFFVGEDIIEAQRRADLLYMRQLKRERGNDVLTSERAVRVEKNLEDLIEALIWQAATQNPTDPE